MCDTYVRISCIQKKYIPKNLCVLKLFWMPILWLAFQIWSKWDYVVHVTEEIQKLFIIIITSIIIHLFIYDYKLPCVFIILCVCVCLGHVVAQLVAALCCKPEGRGFESRCHWIFFNLPNPSSRKMALGLTQPLTEMSTRKIPGG
jgi:hypothetical protein